MLTDPGMHPDPIVLHLPTRLALQCWQSGGHHCQARPARCLREHRTHLHQSCQSAPAPNPRPVRMPAWHHAAAARLWTVCGADEHHRSGCWAGRHTPSPGLPSCSPPFAAPRALHGGQDRQVRPGVCLDLGMLLHVHASCRPDLQCLQHQVHCREESRDIVLQMSQLCCQPPAAPGCTT